MEEVKIIQLNLRGTLFTRTLSSFDRFPNSLLATSFAQKELQPSIKVGEAFYYDRDPILFARVITPLYDYGFWKWEPHDDPYILFQELCYWGLAPQAFPRPSDPMTLPQYIGSTLAFNANLSDRMSSECFLDDRIYCPPDHSVYWVYGTCKQAGDEVKSQALLHGVALNFTLRNEAVTVDGYHYQYDDGSVLCYLHRVDQQYDKESEVITLGKNSTGWTTCLTIHGNEYKAEVRQVIGKDFMNYTASVSRKSSPSKEVIWPSLIKFELRHSPQPYDKKSDFGEWGTSVLEASSTNTLTSSTISGDVTDNDTFAIKAYSIEDPEFYSTIVMRGSIPVEQKKVRSVEVNARVLPDAAELYHEA